MTKKDLLEAINKKLAEIYQKANDPFNKEGDYYFGFQEGLEFAKELIEDLWKKTTMTLPPSSRG